MKLIVEFFEYIRILISTLGLRLKDKIPFLTLEHFLVVFTYPEIVNRNKVECFAFAQLYEMGAVFASKRDWFRVINKVFHSN